MVLACNPKAYVYQEELKRTVTVGMPDRPKPMILKLDDYACHKEKELVKFCKEKDVHTSGTKGGLTLKEQVLDQAANGIVHQHVSDGNIMRFLTPRAPFDDRGYPKSLSRVELAKLVDEGWAKVPPFVLIRSAIKCGVAEPPPPVARVEDYPPAICRAAKLDDVYVNPIIRDLVKPSKLAIDWKAVQANDESEEAELRELGSLFCLDYEDEED